ncbi:MAG: hypothetical protein M1269_06290 [Chloroflexi bacterium]|nr:hypothetical protein [Chloroflexota bacterium]
MLKVSALSDIVAVEPVLEERLSLRTFLNPEENTEKLKAYTPISSAVKVLADIIRASGTTSKDRSHLIFGMPGIGKSYIAVLLANLLGRDPGEDEVKELVSSLSGSEPDLKKVMDEVRLPRKRFLILPLEQLTDKESFKVSLMAALNGVLWREKIEYIPPVSGFLNEIFTDTINQVKNVAGLQGIAIIVDSASGFLAKQQEELAEFAEFCRQSSFPCVMVFLASMSREDAAELDGKPFDRVHNFSIVTGKYEFEENIIGKKILHFLKPDDEEELINEKDIKPLLSLMESKGLFSEKDEEWRKKVVLDECYPMHPISLYALPRLAQKVANDDKNFRTFFLDDVPGTLKNMIQNMAFYQPNKRLALYPLDSLMAYLERNIKAHPVYKSYLEIIEKMRPQVIDLPFSLRIMRTLAALHIMDNSRLPRNAETIMDALHITKREETKVQDTLEALIDKGVLELDDDTGTYSLGEPGPEMKLEEIMEKVKDQVRTTFDQAAFLSRMYELKKGRPASFNDKRRTDKAILMKFSKPDEIFATKKIQTETESLYEPGRKEYIADVILHYVLPSAGDEIEKVCSAAATDKLKEEAILLAVPKKMPEWIEVCQDQEVIRRVLLYESPFCENDYSGRSELEEKAGALAGRVNKELEGFLSADNFFWCWKGDIKDNLPAGGEEEYFSRIFESYFSKFPEIAEGGIAMHAETEDATKARHEAEKILLSPGKKIKLSKGSSSPGENLIKKWLIEPGLLTKVSEDESGGTYVFGKPAENSPLFDLWNYLHFVLVGKERGKKLVMGEDLTSSLFRSPYGLPRSLMEFFFAYFVKGFNGHIHVYQNRRELPKNLPGDDVVPMIITPENLAAMMLDPTDRAVLYFECRDEERELLDYILKLASPGASLDPEKPAFEQVKEKLLEWYDLLPGVTKTSRDLENPHAGALLALLRDTAKTGNAEDLLMKHIMTAAGIDPSQFNREEDLPVLKERLEKAFGDINNYEVELSNSLESAVCSIFGCIDPKDLKGRFKAWEKVLYRDTFERPPSEDAAVLLEAVKSDKPVVEIIKVYLPEKLGWGKLEDWTTNHKDEYTERLSFAKMLCELWMFEGAYLVGSDAEMKKKSILKLSQVFQKTLGLSSSELESIVESMLEAVAW